MNRFRMAAILALFFFAVPIQSGGQQAVVVPIKNPSFEQGTSGWQFGPSSGVTQSKAYAGYGGSFSQNLGISPQAVQKPSPGWQYVTEGVYTLNFSVANYFPNYPGYYTAEIYFGTQELCETSGWGASHFSQVTLTCPSSGYIVIAKSLPSGGPVQGANDLVVKFSVSGWTVLFDKVSLEFIPQ